MKPKRLPRLWCALQGLLPLDACLAAQRGELAWPSNSDRAAANEREEAIGKEPNRVARRPTNGERRSRGPD